MAYEVVELIIQSQVDKFLPMTRRHHKEGYPYLDYSEEKVNWVIDRILKDLDRDTYNIFLCFKDQELIGYAYCVLGEYSFNTQRYANLELIYVVPEYRGSRAFLKLLKAFEEWARLRGCIEFMAGVGLDDEERCEKISNTLVKVGYARFGFSHKKRV